MSDDDRWKTTGWAFVAVLLVAGISFAGRVALDREQIADYWTALELQPSSNQPVVQETIDYDFGSHKRRGIFRKIPDLDETQEILISSPTAPDEADIRDRREVDYQFGEVSGVMTFDAEIRIGDPNIEISGPHRYNLEYSLTPIVADDRFSWNAVGDEWEVGIGDVEIHILAGHELIDLECVGASSTCEVEQVEPGHVMVTASDLEPGEGIRVDASLGEILATLPDSPQPPSGIAISSDPGWAGVVGPMFAALLGSVLVSAWVGRQGRQNTNELPANQMSPSDAPVDVGSHSSANTRAPAVPIGLTPAQGGVLYQGSVQSSHKVAWLIEAAAHNEVEISRDAKDTVLRRGTSDARLSTSERIETFFKAEDAINLGSYDSTFATAWTLLGRDLEQWQQDSPLWDRSGNQRRTLIHKLSYFTLLIWAAALFVAAGLSYRFSAVWLIPAILGAGLTGAAITGWLRLTGFKVLSAEGNQRRQEVKSFRKFLSNLGPQDATDFVEPGSVGEYSAWAIALGVDRQWEGVISQLQDKPGYEKVDAFDHMGGRSLVGAMALTSQAPKSSSSNGFSSGGSFSGGFSSGGGSGGGGGGSW